MEVSRQSDSVTHAVIGNKESVQMGVSNSATLMHVLSTALYTHPMLAAVREIICNGWDGHIISKNTDTSLQITADGQFLTIRDFGPGIPHDKIGEIYGTYGASTKRHDGEQTGGFGLGSKAPFAYTDNFEVTSMHGGQKTIYRVSKSSMAAGGSPTIDTIVKLPCNETGIQVKVNIKSSMDHRKFEEYVREVCLLGEIKATLNGIELDRLPTSESPTGYIINSARGTNLTRINVRYGNVVYPIPKLEAFADIWQSVNSVLCGLWNEANVIFMAEPNMVTIAPSREALIFTEQTVEYIKKLLTKLNPDRAVSSPKTSRQVSRTQVNKIIPAEKYFMPGDLNKTIHLQALHGTSLTVAGGPFNFDARKAAVSFAISRRSLSVSASEVLIKRMKNAVHKGLVDKTKGKRFIAATTKHRAHCSGKKQVHGAVADTYLRKALHKEVTAPIFEELKKHDFIDVTKFRYVDSSSYKSRHVSPWKFTVGDGATLFGFLTPRIVLARSQAAIKNFLKMRKYKEEGYDLSGWMVYQIPVQDKHHAAIEKIFRDLGIEVHKYVPATVPVERAKPSDDPNWKPAERKATPKRKGYLTLWSSHVPGDDTFTLSEARSSCKPEHHVVDPIAYVVLNSGSDYQRKRFSEFTPATCRVLNKVFGHKVAVITSNQIDKLEKLGIPELSKFIYAHVDETLSAAKDFPRYLAFGQHVVDSSRSTPYGAKGILSGLMQHEGLAANLPGKPFRFCVSAQTMAYAQVWEDQDFRAKRTPKCNALKEKVKRSKDVDTLVEQIDTSPWAHYVDLSAVARSLHIRQPNDPGLSIPYQIVTHLMTPVETQQ